MTGGTSGSGEARTWAGAGVVLHLTDTVVRDCVFRNNEAVPGGAVWMGGQGASRLDNCLIEDLQVTGNTSENKGGGVSLSTLHPGSRVEGYTIVGNTALIGGGLRVAGDMTIGLRRCLLAFNLGGAATSVDAGSSLAAGCGT